MSTATILEPTAFITWLSHVHPQFAVAQVISIKHANGFLRLHLVAHFHKSEALRLAAIAVLDQRYRGNSARLKEKGPQIIFRGGVRQVTYVQLGFHFSPYDACQAAGV